jgi:hypothetical protein
MEFHKISQTFEMRVEFLQIQSTVNHEVSLDVRRALPDQTFNRKEMKKVQIHPFDSMKTTSMATSLDVAVLIEFLRERWETFSCRPADMPGVPKELAEHTLRIYPRARPVTSAFLRAKTQGNIKELHRLQDAKFIHEIVDTTWLANSVLVPKKNTDEEHMCIDFTDLNI